MARWITRLFLAALLIVLLVTGAQAERRLGRFLRGPRPQPSDRTVPAPYPSDSQYHRYIPSPYYEPYPQFYGGFHARHLQIYAYPGGQAGFRGAPW